MEAKGHSRSFLLLILLCMSLSSINTKVASCRNKFKEDDWIYCTKFGASDQGTIDVEIKAKFTTIYKSGEDNTEVEIGVYKDDAWDEVQDKKLTCN